MRYTGGMRRKASTPPLVEPDYDKPTSPELIGRMRSDVAKHIKNHPEAHVELDGFGERTVFLSNLRVVNSAQRGHGAGRDLMKVVLASADKNKAWVALQIGSDDDMDEVMLFDWYSRLGFRSADSGTFRVRPPLEIPKPKPLQVPGMEF